MTTTDITVRAGASNVGDGETVSDINEEVVQKSQGTIKRLLEVRLPSLLLYRGL